MKNIFKHSNRSGVESEADYLRRPVRFSLRYKLAAPVFLLVFLGFAFILYSTFHTVRDMMTSHKAVSGRLPRFFETLRLPISAKKKALKACIDLLAEQEDVEAVIVENANGEVIGSSGTASGVTPHFSIKGFLWGRKSVRYTRPYRLLSIMMRCLRLIIL